MSRTCVSCSCLCVVGVVVGWQLLHSFRAVKTLEVAIVINGLTATVSPNVLYSGMHYVGPFAKLERYATTLQNIEYTSSHQPKPDELHMRTADGLPVLLSVSFQYQLLVDEVLQLYEDFGGGDAYESVYFDVGTHLISELGCQFTAYQFFNERQLIASEMAATLDEYFTQHLHASVVSLQISECTLPNEFNEAITNTVTQRQNITAAQKYVDSMKITLETHVMAATRDANATVATARGAASVTLQAAHAQAEVETQRGFAEAEIYVAIRDAFGFDKAQLFEYIYIDEALATSAPGSQLFVGVEPAALVQNYAPG